MKRDRKGERVEHSRGRASNDAEVEKEHKLNKMKGHICVSRKKMERNTQVAVLLREVKMVVAAFLWEVPGTSAV